MYRTGDDLNGDDLGLNDRSIHISFSHQMANSVSLYRKAEHSNIETSRELSRL